MRSPTTSTADHPVADDSNAQSDDIELALPEVAGLRFDLALAQALPQYSRSRLQAWIAAGRVTLDGRVADPRKKVWGGESVIVRPTADPADTTFAAENIGLTIVDEDDALLVIDKPAGMVVHPGSGNWDGTLQNALLH
jgi:23S rRNA pseudouridine1911/1915/1917 synthase